MLSIFFLYFHSETRFYKNALVQYNEKSFAQSNRVKYKKIFWKFYINFAFIICTEIRKENKSQQKYIYSYDLLAD